MKQSKQSYEKLKYKDMLAVAVMLFGLFFGAGNLIFPVHMGQLAGEGAWIASAGFILTGVGLPLLGVAAIGRSKSEGLLEMAGHVGKGWSIFFSITFTIIKPICLNSFKPISTGLLWRSLLI